jgi:hypothetical protein
MIDRERRALKGVDQSNGPHVASRHGASRSQAGNSAASMLVGLQKSVGNRAVGGMLTAQRDVTTLTLGQGADRAQSPMDTGAPRSQSGAAVAALTAEQRNELIRLTGNRISRAFTAFALAAEQKRAAIKAAAADGPDFASLLLEIALGVLLPAVSRGIAGLAAELPAAASSTAYRVALAAMNEERTTKLLETGVRFGREFLKGETKLEGETEVDTFLNKLEDLFNKGADEVDKHLPDLSDDALGITCAAYDPSVASLNQFRTAVDKLVARYESQVKPIGTTEYHWGNSQSSFSLYWVISPAGGKRLALLENRSLKQWISPELQATAIEKFKELPVGRYYRGQVPEIRADQVEDLAG